MKYFSHSLQKTPLLVKACRKNTHWFAVSISALLLASCGSNSNSGSTTEDPTLPPDTHVHNFTTLISMNESPNLYFLEGGETSFDRLDDPMVTNASRFIQADSGTAVAVLGNQQIQFVGLYEDDSVEYHDHGPHLFELTAEGSHVTSAAGHFSVLDSAENTLLTPVSTLHAATEFEETIDVANQTAPAHLLDEDTESWLVFADQQATVYQAAAATDIHIDCTTLSASLTIEDMTLLVCDNQLSALTNDNNTWAFNGVDTPDIDLTELQWASLYDHAFALVPGTQTIYALHLEETPIELEALTLSTSPDSNLCYLAIEPEAHEHLFAVTDKATALVLEPNAEDEHVYDEIYRLALDESGSDLPCEQIKAGAGPETLLVVDNAIHKLYQFDAHGGPYHIHSRIELPAGMSVADLVVLQTLEDEGGHDHTH